MKLPWLDSNEMETRSQYVLRVFDRLVCWLVFVSFRTNVVQYHAKTCLRIFYLRKDLTEKPQICICPLGVLQRNCAMSKINLDGNISLRTRCCL